MTTKNVINIQSNLFDFFDDDIDVEGVIGIDRFNHQGKLFVDCGSVTPKRKFNSLEVFAGAGGLALGFEKAGFNNLASIEIDEKAANTLKENRPEWNVIQGDINEIVEDGIFNHPQLKELKNVEIDVITGGFPCQAFSYAGKGLGFRDTRGTLFHPFALMVGKLQPKMFVAENVKGLVNHDEGRTLTTMIEIFTEEGYQVFWHVLNSWDYETAQKRERIFIVGIREDLYDSQQFDYAYPKPFDYKPVLRDVLEDVPDSPGLEYSENKYKVMELVPAGGCWVDLPEEVAKEYMGKSWYSGGGKRGMARRMSWDEPSLTLTTSPSQKQTERCHPEETRPFTVREYARIQGFPDEWEFSGSVYDQYRQIGNAVPVNLAKNVAKSVIRYLNQFD